MPSNCFIISQKFDLHPVVKTNKNIRINYYHVLKFFVDQCSENDVYIEAKMEQYRKLFVGNAEYTIHSTNIDGIVKSIVNNTFKPWRRKLRYFLLCDLAFVLASKSMVQDALRLMKKYLRKKQRAIMDEFFENVFDNSRCSTRVKSADILLNQIHANQAFMMRPEKRIIVTANMSAGKSTLINAIVGKPVARTAQEACTSTLCYVYNKAFEDNAVHFLASPINLNATYDELYEMSKNKNICIASYFRTISESSYRICMIDTPGVNSALHKEHGELTRNILSYYTYDKVVYVFNANRLGTDEELDYLKYISERIPKNKIVFVINKLDNYRNIDDSIEASIDGVRNDLARLGYKNPVICPISAYFAFLVKMKQCGEQLSEDEQDVFDLYAKKFHKPEYDLSRYYETTPENMSSNEDFLNNLCNRCGLYGLETILFGS